MKFNDRGSAVTDVKNVVNLKAHTNSEKCCFEIKQNIEKCS